ncbi:exodeoxyribonuclease V subunit beta [Curvibacter sp. HBC61]|uniref:RecBCD enzyme subunit RecB n=1 Tax=Curvibacter cyanobacteriorum TaxID=3026422 RepID=A0ABT5MZG1_9BURK|nr:exodeoxyribonuclease V subunit beta [Curvibacter sp. HBC61]MDD0838177.1 exodeoxyribonuclease V subunit beta [Curvibacter sp. HBC61]
MSPIDANAPVAAHASAPGATLQPPMQPLDPLTLPWQGRQVIEASAGTGKTWTLAALYVRLVLGHTASGLQTERGLFPPQILVMTFTDAATAELRGRVRARLAQAAQYFADLPEVEADGFLQQLRAQIAPERWTECARRLDAAAQWMDDAAIFTIHGWSHRMLSQHAFDSASLFEQARVEDSAQLQLAAAQDYWRRWCYPLDLSELEALAPLGRHPGELLQRLQPLWAQAERSPEAAEAARQPVDSPDHLVAQWRQWQQRHDALQAQARAAWTPDWVQAVEAAAASKTLKNYQARWMPGWLAAMAAWAEGQPAKLDQLQRFSLSQLRERGWPQAEDHPVTACLDDLCDHLRVAPDIGPAWLAHAAQQVGAAYQAAKARLAQFDFSDLLQRLYEALQAPDGRLAAAIRAQFPVALVDEFQDTDPWQYGALWRIYGGDAGQGTGLIMIGDPKQAIYSFRGADLATYLQARSQAQAVHTLGGNFRSSAGVVAAVNHIFAHAPQPFGPLPFEPVTASNPRVQALQVAGQPQPALTVWRLPGEQPLSKAAYERAMAALCATQMVALLNQGAAQPGQMAVLVRHGAEAKAIRRELAQRGVRSVYLSDRDSVYASPEAHDLWRVLCAVAQPRSASALKAALLTRLWGLSWPALERLLHDEDAWDALVDQFHGWQKIWQQQGLLPMLHHWLHDLGVPRRLLAPEAEQGERRLSNLLHLGDLLQTASQGLQGEGALLRYLEQQLQKPSASGDAAQTRLESDADLVQVITMHKSKGLQYPLVFLPFVGGFRAEKADSGRDDAQRLAEDVRLLYVALTRAEQALWLGVAPLARDLDGESPKLQSALSLLLGRQRPDDLDSALQAWAACPDIVVQRAPEPDLQPYRAPDTPSLPQPALQPQRRASRPWWTASFSALTRELGHRPEAAGTGQTPLSERDERLDDALTDNRDSPEAALSDPAEAAAAPGWNAFPAGSRYGTLLHDLLEWQAGQGWPAAQRAPEPEPGQAGSAAAVLQADATARTGTEAEWAGLLQRQAAALQLDEAQTAQLGQWVGEILRSPLHWVDPAQPLAGQTSPPLVLGQLPPHAFWAEMNFSLPVRELNTQALDALISAQVLPGLPRPSLLPRQLEGMLTGFMDLVLWHGGRYHVLDYKSNRLPDYRPETLAQAVLAHRYDVQYSLYLLALHRLLKSRLPDYQPEQHLGGALYLFARGIDQVGQGLFHERPPVALIEALDQAFSGRTALETLA